MPAPDAPADLALADKAHAQAELILDDFVHGFQVQFRFLTRRAARRFAQRDFQGLRHDASQRATLYREVIDRVERDIRWRLGPQVQSRPLWKAIHAAYARMVTGRKDVELAETFFNSITRRIFNTVGVDPSIEFVTPAAQPHAESGPTRTFVIEPPLREAPPDPVPDAVIPDDAHPGARPSYAFAQALLHVVADTLSDAFPEGDVPFAHRTRDVRAIAERIEAHRATLGTPPLTRAELVKPLFFRGIGAYVIGRLHTGPHASMPFALALHNTPHGLVADAVVLDEDQISILFSFAHSYFQVDIEQTHALVDFLKELLPKKRRAELYISLGYNKHGKTELYRDLLAHFAEIRAHEDMDRFERAPGQRGMVMIVFTMGTYNMVFKLIKDRFDYPKQTTRAGVMDRYHLVFRHDRAGRLVDAQEFEHLELSRDLFTDELLRELRDVASNTVHVTDDTVTIDHTYVERRVTPLDLYLRHEPFGKARAAILDYGQAIRDLARTNIFPGDLLLKNFGVTRHGRVVFYDYDELCFVTDCTYRTKPKAQTYEQEMASDAWFYVGPDDVFPEEFVPTLGLSDDLERVLLEHHAEVFTAAFWNETKARLEDGEILPILPYPDRYRLPPRHDVMPQG